MKTYTRRQALAAFTAFAGTTLVSSVAFGQRTSGPSVRLSIQEPERLKGLGSAEIRKALLKLINVRLEGARSAIPVALCAVSVQKLRSSGFFLSGSFKVSPGDNSLPGDIFLPGDKYIPDCLPGDIFLPRDMYFPADGVERAATDAAISAARASGTGNGLYLAAVPGGDAKLASFPSFLWRC